MFILPLALLAQTVVTTPAGNDALRCASASVVAAPEGQTPMRTTAHFLYYAMQAAHVEPGSGPYLERLTAVAEGAGNVPPPAPEEARTRLADCDRRFPMAASSAAPRLPGDRLSRDIMCLGILSLLQGAAESIREDGDDGAAGETLKAALAPLTASLSDEALAKHGMTGEAQFVTAMGEQIRASLKIGNPTTIARACGAAL